MPELGTSGSAGGPGWATTQVYPPCARRSLGREVLAAGLDEAGMAGFGGVL